MMTWSRVHGGETRRTIRSRVHVGLDDDKQMDEAGNWEHRVCGDADKIMKNEMKETSRRGREEEYDKTKDHKRWIYVTGASGCAAKNENKCYPMSAERCHRRVEGPREQVRVQGVHSECRGGVGENTIQEPPSENIILIVIEGLSSRSNTDREPQENPSPIRKNPKPRVSVNAQTPTGDSAPEMYEQRPARAKPHRQPRTRTTWQNQPTTLPPPRNKKIQMPAKPGAQVTGSILQMHERRPAVTKSGKKNRASIAKAKVCTHPTPGATPKIQFATRAKETRGENAATLGVKAAAPPPPPPKNRRVQVRAKKGEARAGKVIKYYHGEFLEHRPTGDSADRPIRDERARDARSGCGGSWEGGGKWAKPHRHHRASTKNDAPRSGPHTPPTRIATANLQFDCKREGTWGVHVRASRSFYKR
ncbi:hypothetical protein B0H16DRAFT_1704567 [Mycena metata]|uniref:Uncharacterized protein n=1 Tax=Mycena metata TaxID=1033252 RepID=A0AAD7GUK0_9AGAR|nr:hypothetical protein B0H16DRAFT_1704567 [Mycena metata]